MWGRQKSSRTFEAEAFPSQKSKCNLSSPPQKRWKRGGEGKPGPSWQQNLPVNRARAGVLSETAVSAFSCYEQLRSPSFPRISRGWLRRAEEPFSRGRTRCLPDSHVSLASPLRARLPARRCSPRASLEAPLPRRPPAGNRCPFAALSAGDARPRSPPRALGCSRWERISPGTSPQVPPRT